MGAFRVLLRSSRARIAEHYATKHQSGYSCSTRNLKEGIRSFKSQRTSPSSKHTQLPSERKVQGFFTRSRLADGFREPRSCYFLENQLFSSRFHSSSASVPQGIEEISDDLPNSDNLKEPHGGIDVALNAVVKVFTVSSSPSYFLPWQNKPQREVSGSGFILSDRRILTNAHVVADHSYVLVRKHGSPTKFRAKVEAIGHECDLALLRVEDEEFWDGMQALELGEIPFLQDSVAAVGYPQGGDNICVTRGVVSRVEPVQYIHGATHLIAIQIDAAINPGNSGGPAMIDNTVVGVVFQNLCNAENIGYIIPVPVIKHFLADVQERGRYVGFCSLGLVCQATENKQIREHLQMDPEMTGVLVSKVHPLTEVSRYIEKDDVLLSFDGISIANDGSVHFRNRERISFLHYVTMKREGETGVLRVLRKGKELEFSIKLAPVQPLVPNHQFDRLPSYYIFAGLVFVPLTQPYLHEFGEDWYNVSPRRLCDRAFTEMPKKPGEQYVIMSQVLMDDINAGYERLAELQVLKVNGVEIVNLQHLRQLVEGCKEKYLRFDLDDGRVIVLNYEAAQEASVHILKHHRISSSMSADLLQAESEPEKSEDVERKIGVACSAD